MSYRYAKANNKCIKNYDKKTHIIIPYVFPWKHLHGPGLSRKLLVNGFKWIKKLSKFNKDFV